jgi:hypothetical protein
MLATTVTTPKEALERLREENAFRRRYSEFPNLPHAAGFSLAAAVRELPGGGSLHLLPLTSARRRTGDPQAGAARLSASVYKPIRPKQLSDALSQSFDLMKAPSARKASAAPLFDRLSTVVSGA